MHTTEEILRYVAFGIELVSAAILLTGFAKAGIEFVRTELSKRQGEIRNHGLSQARLTLGTYILLGLDFYIVSDIMHSMISPELNELINLLLIVVMRTTIGFFLSREITEIEKTSSQIIE